MKNIICKNDALFFDMLSAAHTGGSSAKAEQGKIKVALQAFLMEPLVAVKKQIQAFGVSTDFEQLTTNAFNVTVQEDNFDLGYEQAFREQTLEQGRDFWEIYDVQNGLSFRQIEEGGRIEVEGLTGTVVQAYVDYYGGALGWTDKMIRFRKIPAMVDMAMIFRNKFWSNKADNHYLLLATAAAGNQTTYQGAVADGQLQRDIQTINEAAFQLTDRNKDKGYGDTAAAQLVLYANPADKARINAAFRATTANLGPAGRIGDQISWNIKVIYTFNSNITAGTPILILPKNKIQSATAMEPTTFTEPVDPLTLNQFQAVWSIYGAIVGDTDQAQSFLMS